MTGLSNEEEEKTAIAQWVYPTVPLSWPKRDSSTVPLSCTSLSHCPGQDSHTVPLSRGKSFPLSHSPTFLDTANPVFYFLGQVSNSLTGDCLTYTLFGNWVNSILEDPPSRGGGVTVYVKDINQPSMPTPFLFCSCVRFCLLGPLNCTLHSINSPDNSPFSHSVLPVMSLPYFSFQLNVSL